MVYLILYGYLITQRILELALAKSNESFQKNRGAIEVKDPYYPLIVLTHVVFLVALFVEAYWRHGLEASITYVWLGLFLILQFLRIWLIYSMGRYWNTKVIVLPEAKLINTGLFRIVNHPNYWIVFFELLIIPLMFHAYWTAVIFPILHGLLMTKRIPLENRALRKIN